MCYNIDMKWKLEGIEDGSKDFGYVEFHWSSGEFQLRILIWGRDQSKYNVYYHTGALAFTRAVVFHLSGWNDEVDEKSWAYFKNRVIAKYLHPFAILDVLKTFGLCEYLPLILRWLIKQGWKDHFYRLPKTKKPVVGI